MIRLEVAHLVVVEVSLVVWHRSPFDERSRFADDSRRQEDDEKTRPQPLHRHFRLWCHPLFFFFFFASSFCLLNCAELTNWTVVLLVRWRSDKTTVLSPGLVWFAQQMSPSLITTHAPKALIYMPTLRWATPEWSGTRWRTTRSRLLPPARPPTSQRNDR